MNDKNLGRVPSGQVLAVPDEPQEGLAASRFDPSRVADLEAALAPFAAMARVMETRARVTFGESVKDSEIVCESSGEAGMGILTMGHFRDAAALLPNATGWRGLYRPPFDRAASIASLATGDDGIAQETGK